MTDTQTIPTLQDRCRGCLLGLTLGDAVGRYYEGVPPDWLQQQHTDAFALLKAAKDRELRYTDDAQMTIAVAETLVKCGHIDEEQLCASFVENYHPWRGYGRGARVVLEAMEEGRDYKTVAANHFPGGSYGNGAAMRVAPIGFFFNDDLDRVWEQARLSALPTHVHPLGIEGTQLLAIAVALATQMTTFDKDTFYQQLLERSVSDEFRDKLRTASQISNPDEIEKLGNGIKAIESVVTAIACFAEAPDSYERTIGQAAYIGGDTDTIGAMAGAVSGAFLGVDAIPSALTARLEDEAKGRSYILSLADELHAARCEQR